MLMLSDADKGGADKLLFSQGKHRGLDVCGATLMQPSESMAAFGVLSEWGFHHPHTHMHASVPYIYMHKRTRAWLHAVILMNADAHMQPLLTHTHSAGDGNQGRCLSETRGAITEHQ